MEELPSLAAERVWSKRRLIRMADAQPFRHRHLSSSSLPEPSPPSTPSPHPHYPHSLFPPPPPPPLLYAAAISSPKRPLHNSVPKHDTPPHQPKLQQHDHPLSNALLNPPYEIPKDSTLIIPEEFEEKSDDSHTSTYQEMPERDTFSPPVSPREHREGQEVSPWIGIAAKDFIMDRFLPAAKAVASDTPHTSSRSCGQSPLSCRARAAPLPRSVDISYRPSQLFQIPRAKSSVFAARVTQFHPPEYDNNSRKGVSFNPCGFFCIPLRSAAATARARPVDVHHDTSSGSDEEEAVVREVKATVQSKRKQSTQYTPRSTTYSDSSRSTSFRGSSPLYATSLRGSPLHNQAGLSVSASPGHDQSGHQGDEPQFYDAVSKFPSQTPTPAHVSPHKNGVSRSPFHECKGFSGIPNDWTIEETVFAETASNHLIATPGASPRDYKLTKTNSVLNKNGCSPASQGFSHKISKAFQHMTDRSSHMPPEEVVSAGLQLQHEVESKKQNSSRRIRHPSLETISTKFFQNSVSASRNLPTKCLLGTNSNGKHYNGGFETIRSAEGMGWPLGMSSYHADASFISPGAQRKYNVPSPPLPPSPSDSWLQKAVLVNATKPSLRTPKLGPAKKLEFSSIHATRMRRDDRVKSNHLQPRHLSFSEELHHGANSVMS